MSTVFLSYAKDDAQHARKIYNALVTQGVDVWFDEASLLPGQKWKQEIEIAISASRYFIALMSNNSVSKIGYVQKELKIALDVLDQHPTNQVFLIPVRIEECKIDDPKLKEIHYVDFFPDFDFGFSKLLKAINHTSKNQSAPDPKPNYKESKTSPAQIDSANQFFEDINKKRTELQRREEKRLAARNNSQQKLEATLRQIENRAVELVTAYNEAAGKRTLKAQVADTPISQSSHRIIISFGTQHHWLTRVVNYPNGIPAIQLVKVHGPPDQTISGTFNLTNDSINTVIEANVFWVSLNSSISADATAEIVGDTVRDKQPLEKLADTFVLLLQRAIEFELVRTRV